MKKIQLVKEGSVHNVTDRHAQKLIDHGVAIEYQVKQEKQTIQTKEEKTRPRTKKK